MSAAETCDVQRICTYCGLPFLVGFYAIKRGRGTHCSKRCAAYAAAKVPRRAQPERIEAPTYRWPDEAHLIPTRCPREHCGGMVEIDAPYGLAKVGDARCVMCSRTVANLKPGLRPIVVAQPPEKKDRHQHKTPRPAPKCGHTITRRSSSGYCPPCLQTRPCVRCPAVAGTQARHGLCAACYELSRRRAAHQGVRA